MQALEAAHHPIGGIVLTLEYDRLEIGTSGNDGFGQGPNIVVHDRAMIVLEVRKPVLGGHLTASRDVDFHHGIEGHPLKRRSRRRADRPLEDREVSQVQKDGPLRQLGHEAEVVEDVQVTQEIERRGVFRKDPLSDLLPNVAHPTSGDLGAVPGQNRRQEQAVALVPRSEVPEAGISTDPGGSQFFGGSPRPAQPVVVEVAFFFEIDIEEVIRGGSALGDPPSDARVQAAVDIAPVLHEVDEARVFGGKRYGVETRTCPGFGAGPDAEAREVSVVTRSHQGAHASMVDGGRTEDESPVPSGMALQPWPRSGSTPGPDLIIFRARYDLVQNPRNRERFTRLVLETRPWVNVIAITDDARVVVVRQYRFGSRSITTEIPGGVIEPGESPKEAAQRELREETGFESPEWIDLGSSSPNPAFHDNTCWHFLAKSARRVSALALDPGEDIEVDLLPEAEFLAQIRAGAISHSLVISAAARVFDLRPFA
jgi:ADP-ribose pyrophosphatase